MPDIHGKHSESAAQGADPWRIVERHPDILNLSRTDGALGVADADEIIEDVAARGWDPQDVASVIAFLESTFPAWTMPAVIRLEQRLADVRLRSFETPEPDWVADGYAEHVVSRGRILRGDAARTKERTRLEMLLFSASLKLGTGAFVIGDEVDLVDAAEISRFLLSAGFDPEMVFETLADYGDTKPGFFDNFVEQAQVYIAERKANLAAALFHLTAVHYRRTGDFSMAAIAGAEAGDVLEHTTASAQRRRGHYEDALDDYLQGPMRDRRFLMRMRRMIMEMEGKNPPIANVSKTSWAAHEDTWSAYGRPPAVLVKGKGYAQTSDGSAPDVMFVDGKYVPVADGKPGGSDGTGGGVAPVGSGSGSLPPSAAPSGGAAAKGGTVNKLRFLPPGYGWTTSVITEPTAREIAHYVEAMPVAEQLEAVADLRDYMASGYVVYDELAPAVLRNLMGSVETRGRGGSGGAGGASASADGPRIVGVVTVAPSSGAGASGANAAALRAARAASAAQRSAAAVFGGGPPAPFAGGTIPGPVQAPNRPPLTIPPVVIR